MSDVMGQARARLPRFADTAVERARLTVVPRRRRPQAPRLPFAILVGVVLLAGVVGLLMFNTSMQQASFTATALEASAGALHAEEQSLRMELDRLRDPQQVATRAEQLGMVPMANPAFLRLSDGRILGSAVPAAPTDGQRITPLPLPEPRSFTGPQVRVPWDEPPADARGSRTADRLADGAAPLTGEPPDGKKRQRAPR